MALKANKIEKEINLVLAQTGTSTHPSFDVCIKALNKFPENIPKHEP